MLTAHFKVFRTPLRRCFTGGSDPWYNISHSSQLRVMHTNQWPIPYYKRSGCVPRTLYPENDYNVTIQGNTHTSPDDSNVFYTQRFLKQSMWGREVLEAVNKMGLKGSLNTRIESPISSAKIYMNDLLKHIDYTKKENERILKKHKFSDAFS
ncbi:unnamed protein product [Blepharisma stoltei]|uniref:Uncharacterized protein n=1 Tax=Blepharisma stoltei TaxID=1481888 RepID=A0AAU9IYI6_9CILI|nr:unnamed protein product [Blepharisma stoltei]